MFSIPKFSLNRPITILMIFLAVLLWGTIVIFKLPVELMPNMSFGNVTIFIGVRGGMPPPQIENLITRKVEEAVSGVSHLKNIISTSKMNRSIVTIEFEPGTDMDSAAAEVRENFYKINDQLPHDQIEKPVIAKYEENDVPIMILGLTSDISTPELMRELVEDDLKERLSRVTGVANVEIGGGRERKILVELEQSRLQAYRIPVKKIINSISLANVDVLVGDVSKDWFREGVKIPGAFRSLNELNDLTVEPRENYGVIRLKHLAEVKDSYLEAQSYSRLSVEGKETKDSVSVYIQKESLANTILVTNRLYIIIEEYKKELAKKHPDINLLVVSEHAVMIKTAIKNVIWTLFYGMLLAVIVLYLFLKRISYTLIIAAVIPVSVMMAFNCMLFAGITLNVISLMGLALGIGMLLDNSIVVLENIFNRRHKTRNQKEVSSAKDIIIESSNEMALAIVASTLTTIIVFLPIVFINKQIRLLYSDLALSVTFILLASMFVALSAVPLLYSRAEGLRPVFKLKGIKEKMAGKADFILVHMVKFKDKLKKIIGSFLIFIVRYSMYFASLTPFAGRGSEKTEKKYCRIIKNISENRHSVKFYYLRALGLAIRFRCAVFGAALLLFGLSVLIYRCGLEKEFISSTEQNEFTIYVELKAGTKLDITNEVVSEVETRLSGVPEISKTLKTTQSRIEGWSSKVYVTLVPKRERMRTTEEIINGLRSKFRDIGDKYDGAYVYFSEPQTSKEFVVDVFGYDYTKIAEIANKLAQEMDRFTEANNGRGFVDLKLRYKEGRPTYDFIIDNERAAFYNLTTKEIADSLHAQLRGMRASFFHTGKKEVEIVPRLSKKYWSNLKDITQGLTVVNPDGRVVYVRDLVQRDAGPINEVPSEIWRKNKTRVIQVSGTMDGISLQKAADGVNNIISKMDLPKYYYCDIGGEYQQMTQNNREFALAILISLLFVYFVLASLFESYIHPLIIMTAVPLALIGVVLAVWATIKTVSIGVFIGMLMLGGIVVNNSIILIDRLNYEVRKKSFSNRFALKKSVLTVGWNRLRPIMMTTLTTVFGLIPMAMDKSDSSNLWTPLAITVIGGLTVSTFLTLLIIPSIYYTVENIVRGTPPCNR